MSRLIRLLSIQFLPPVGRVRRPKPVQPTLGDETRRRILEALCQSPGLTQTELVSRVGRAMATIRYHLHFLTARDQIDRVEFPRERRFFPPKMDRDVIERIAVMRRGRIMAVATAVMEKPGLLQIELCQKTGLTRKILGGYIDIMERAGLIVEERKPALRRYYPGPQLVGIMARLETQHWILNPQDATDAVESGPGGPSDD